MAHTVRRVAAGAAGLLVIGAATAGGAMAASSPAAAAWQIVKSARIGQEGQFTAVAATGKTTGWAFEGSDYTAAPQAYQFSGSSWRKVSFPGNKDQQVITAAATSPSDVWAFEQGFGTASRVLRYNGRSWSVVRSFSDQVVDASVLASNDVWVYGSLGFVGFQPSLGVWHYNGSTWRQVSKSIQGGSALSATSAWGFNGVDVEHWNGAKWTATSVKSLLPAKKELNNPAVDGVLALSSTNVYAIGDGNNEDEGGPLVVLHYNGRRWTRLAEGLVGGSTQTEFSYDGNGGLWLPMLGESGAPSYLVHYSDGKLTRAALPVAAAKITVSATSRIPGSAYQFAGGFTHTAGNPTESVVGVVLKYS
jgi:hypothetical protein